MGNQQPTAHQELRQVRSRLEGELGSIPVTGRYHVLPKTIDDDYICDKKKELGTGFNGTVFVGKSRASGEEVAVKPFKLFGLRKEEKRMLRNEVELFLGMDHPHIAILKDVYESHAELSLVMEHLEGGELFDRISMIKSFSEHEAAHTASMILLAVRYLHEKHIVHRDLKLENFLYATKEHKWLKLIDFGFSRHHREGAKKMTLGCGTSAYMAPEVVDMGVGYDSQCDLWSMGVVVFILLMGYMPFSGGDLEVQRKIKVGDMLIKEETWGGLTEEAKSFVLGLLVVDPSKRMTASQALEHPWVINRFDGEDPGTLFSKESLASNGRNADQIIESLQKFAGASKFRKACMKMMALSLTIEQRSTVRAAFLEIDVDKAGTVTLTEFKTVLQANLEITDEEVANIFNSLDSRCDQHVEYSDFLSAMVGSKIAIDGDLIRSAFRRFDVDNTGFISADNLRAVLGSCNRGDIDKIMAEADALCPDGKIDIEEFEAYLTQEATDDQLEAAFGLIQDEKRKIALESKEGQKSSTPAKSGKARSCVIS